MRTLLVLLHLAAMFLMSLPSSHRLGDRAHWQSPRQQREIANWANLFGVDKDGFQDFLWDTTQHYLKIRKGLVHPFLVYADYSGARQAWTMFGTPRSNSARFEVSVEIDGKWQLVFKPHSSTHDWNRWQFDHNRIRKLLGRLASQPHDGAYRPFVHWLTRRVAEDFPEATRARVALISWPLQAPNAVRAGEPRKENLVRYQEFTLADYR